MANPLSLDQLVGAVQALEQGDVVIAFFKEHTAGKKDARDRGKFRFLEQQAVVDTSEWDDTVVELREAMLRDYCTGDA